MLIPNLEMPRLVPRWLSKNIKRIDTFDFLIPKPSRKKIFNHIPKNKLFLGRDFYDQSKPFCIPFDAKKRITIVIAAKNGFGKSTIFKTTVYDNLHGRFDRYVLDCGAKLDSQTIRFPNTKPEYIKIIEEFGGSPTGYPYAKYVTPAFLTIDGSIGEPFSLGFDSLVGLCKMSPTTGIYDILSIFNTHKGESAGTILTTLYLSDDPPDTYYKLDEYIKEYEKRNPQAKQLRNEFIQLTHTKQLTDSYLSMSQFPKLIHDHKILCIEFELGGNTNDNILSIFLNTAIRYCMQDRRLSVNSSNTKGYIDNVLTIAIDEADVFASKKTTTAETIRELLTKYREINPQKGIDGINNIGCDLILSTQHLSFLDDYILPQIDYIIIAKVEDEKDIKKLKAKGLNDDQITLLQNLPVPETFPKPFAVINPNNEISIFYPSPTLSAMK